MNRNLASGGCRLPGLSSFSHTDPVLSGLPVLAWWRKGQRGKAASPETQRCVRREDLGQLSPLKRKSVWGLLSKPRVREEVQSKYALLYLLVRFVLEYLSGSE